MQQSTKAIQDKWSPRSNVYGVELFTFECVAKMDDHANDDHAIMTTINGQMMIMQKWMQTS